MLTRAAIPGSIELLTQIAREKDARPVRFRKLAVHHYKPSSALPDRQIALSGTVTLFLARRDSKLFQDLHAAVLNPGSVDDRKAAAQLNHYFAARPPRTLDDLMSSIRCQPILADLRYGGATLVENILLPHDAELAAIPLPYNGGRLADEGFSLAEYHLDYLDSDIEVLLVRNDPPLTDAEMAALKAVPDDILTINVGRGPGEVACSVALLTAAVVVEVAVVAATWAITGAYPGDGPGHINPEVIKELGPVGTARALVNLRRDLLQGRAGRQ